MKMKTTLAVLLIMELYGLSSGLMKEHFFVNENESWSSAQEYCKTNFHDLSTFTDENEYKQFLGDVADQTSAAWVGLYTESGVWKWSGGENATQISWDPSNEKLENDTCAFLQSGINKKVKCTAKYPFFCMNIIEFVLVLQNETWDGALEYCQKQYNDLSSLSTMERLASALLESTQAETEYVWTGLRFLAGDWFWVNGDDLNYTAWDQNEQPQCPARDLRCGALDKQTHLWTNRNCEEKFHFLCQKKVE